MLSRGHRNVSWCMDSWAAEQREETGKYFGKARPLRSPPPPPKLELELVEALIPVSTSGGSWNLPKTHLPLLKQLVLKTSISYHLPPDLVQQEVEHALLRMRLGRVKKDWRVWLHKSSERSGRYKVRQSNISLVQTRSGWSTLLVEHSAKVTSLN